MQLKVSIQHLESAVPARGTVALDIEVGDNLERICWCIGITSSEGVVLITLLDSFAEQLAPLARATDLSEKSARAIYRFPFHGLTVGQRRDQAWCTLPVRATILVRFNGGQVLLFKVQIIATVATEVTTILCLLAERVDDGTANEVDNMSETSDMALFRLESWVDWAHFLL